MFTIKIDNFAGKPMLDILPEGMGDYGSADGFGAVLTIEGDILYVWADINQEDPTHIIDLNRARLEYRR